MKKLKLNITLLALLFSLIGCQSVPNDAVDIKEGLDAAIKETKSFNGPKPLTQIPNSVQQELMLNLSLIHI